MNTQQPPQQTLSAIKQIDIQQAQIDQLIRGVAELNQKSLTSDFAYSAAISAIQETIHQQKKSLDQLSSDLADLAENCRTQFDAISQDNAEADKKILANAGAIARILLAIGNQEKIPSERLKTPLEKRIENFLDKNLPN